MSGCTADPTGNGGIRGAAQDQGKIVSLQFDGDDVRIRRWHVGHGIDFMECIRDIDVTRLVIGDGIREHQLVAVPGRRALQGYLRCRL